MRQPKVHLHLYSWYQYQESYLGLFSAQAKEEKLADIDEHLSFKTYVVKYKKKSGVDSLKVEVRHCSKFMFT